MADHWILLIDPFKNLLNVYRTILEEETYHVETALSMEEALHQLSTHRYSIVMTEFFLPLEKTYLLIERIKQSSPETHIIMITIETVNDPTYEKLFAIGLDNLILKPCSPEKILVHVKKGLRQRDFILKNREAERQALVDLTVREVQPFSINPIFFKKSLRQELKRAKRHHHPLSLVLVEIPGEEKIGDRMDYFYLELARIASGRVREEDIVGRDNRRFGILLPETDQTGSQAFMHRFSHLVQTHPSFQSDSVLRPIVQTLSIQSFTYPDTFLIPESLKTVLKEINNEYPAP